MTREMPSIAVCGDDDGDAAMRYLPVTIILFALVLAACEPPNAIQGAAGRGSIADLDAQLAQGVDINYCSPVQGSPLSIAASRGDMAMVRHLMDRGADVNACAPLADAAWYGNEEMARYLIGKGADLNLSSRSDSPLADAAEKNHPSMVNLLLAAGAKPNGPRGDGRPMWNALFGGYDDIVLKLLDAGADPNLGNCLTVAIRHSPSRNSTRLLLNHHANPNLADERGFTPLHAAAVDGRIDEVRLLLAHGAKPSLTDRDRKTALDYARKNGNLEVAAELESASAR
jgi:ankyrin repeat protein